MGEFHQSLLSIFERLGRARLSVMFVGEQAVSAMYSLIVDGREYHLQGGFNAQFARSVSLGSLHLGYSIERAFADGVQVIDLLVGGGRSTDFKRHFAIPLERSCLVQIVRSRRLRLAYGLLDAVRGSRRESLER
jgi:CelD/BcsL family acetyltransferase involved in cellulose biosynthesis